MTTTTISIEDFVQQGRDAALEAFDAFVRKKLGHDKARGWLDSELPALIPALDAHMQRVARRIADKESAEPGSATIVITGLAA